MGQGKVDVNGLAARRMDSNHKTDAPGIKVWCMVKVCNTYVNLSNLKAEHQIPK